MIKKTLGFIVNPIAGMGGAVGLKGTDGEETLKSVIALGAIPTAPDKARLFLSCLKPIAENINLFAGSESMGQHEAESIGFDYQAIGSKKEVTTSADTKAIAEIMMKETLIFWFFAAAMERQETS